MSRKLGLLFFTLFAFTVFGETTGLSGNVLLDDGSPAVMAHIMLEGTQHATVTDQSGNFSFEGLINGTFTLHVSFVGMKSQKLQVQWPSSNPINIRLSSDEELLSDVMVEAKSVLRETEELPYAVTAIDAKPLQNLNLDVNQALNTVSGIRIMEEGGLGSKFTFTLNGFSGNQVKFFMDGIPMDHFGSSLSLNNIPINLIDRIEVYKGVVPVHLGSDALGGAVNIITNKKRNFLDLSYSYGSFNTHRSSLNTAYTNKSGFTTRASLSHNYSDNNYTVLAPIRDFDEQRVVGEQEVERFHDRYRSGSARLELGVVDKKYADDLLFGIITSANDQQVQTGSTMNSVYGGITRNSNSVIPTLRYGKTNLLPGLDVRLNSAYNFSESQIIDTLRGVTYNWLGDTSYTPGSNDGELQRTFTTLTDRSASAQLNANYTINPQHSLALNYSYNYFKRKSFDSENPDNPSNQFPLSLSKQIIGLSYQYDISEKWRAIAFGKLFMMNAITYKQLDFALETQRTEAVRNEKQDFGYGLATYYFITPKLQLKASYERTSRLPDPDEIFGDGLFVNANPDLKPEQSHNLNVGANYNSRLANSHKVNVEGSFVYRKATDLIYQIVKPSSPETSYGNVSKTRNLGVEGSIGYSYKELFRLGANVTFQDITDRADSIYNDSYTNGGSQENYQYGFRLPNTPYLFANANAGVSFKDVGMEHSKLGINYYFNFVEQYFLSWAEMGSADTKKVIPRQTSHNIELTYSLQEGKYNIAFECRNFTNELLYDRFYLQKPGRAFYIKLRYALDY
ncbi:TonB-dependent receptor domain-containing protein [Owenweeksia hongkongensis]|uniref:TonB-dependent receptor n=1 Tax=Owenweeksia hongkongensis TaxID=253245 RepID=UPI003A91C241